jgi:acetyl esterase/lipase
MIKYLLFCLLIVLVAMAVWFKMQTGPQQLEMADRWYPGSEFDGTVETGIAYGDYARQKLDIYMPTKSGPHPVLIFFHGGSWKDGDRPSYAFFGRTFAARGIVTVIADYRKYPEVKFPDFVEDAATSIAWTHSHIARHGGDPAQIFVAGHSAGAHLASLVTLDRQWLGREGLDANVIKGMIGLAGPYDFYPFTNVDAENALGSWSRPEETQAIHFVRDDAPPLLLLHGDADTKVRPRNSKVLAEAITGLGGKAGTHYYPGIDHSDIIMAVARPFRNKAPVANDIVEFMRANSAHIGQ